MANKGKRTGSKPDWRPFEKVFGKRDGFESEFILPRRWDGADIYSDLNKLLADYSDAVKNNRSRQSHKELEDRIDKVCGSVLEMLRLYLHGYPSEAYAVMKALMEKLDEDPLYIDGSDVKSLYRMSSVKENIDDKPRIFHAPYNIRPKIRTYRYSIAGYPSLYLAESLELAEEEMHLFRDKKPAIAARFEFDRDFAKENLTKILEFGVRPQDLASPEDDKTKNAPEGGAEKDGEENAQAKNTPEGSAEKDVNEKAQEETIRGKFEDSVRRADDIKERFALQPSMPEAADRTAKAGLPAPERYMLWYPLIAACSYVRTNREDPFAPEYIVPQLLAQWMRSENTGELVGIRYFSCYSRHASEKGRNYVFPSSGDPIVLKDGVRQYCPVLNEAFAFTGTEYLPEYAEVGALQKALEIKVAERAFRLTREDYKKETKVELPAQLMYVAARSFMWCEKLKSADNMDGVVSIGDSAFYGCER
ncbi:MAG: hypothetical protein IIZ56_02505, partial [Clostridia bacterium]|nr:hypothetical protein [Clostridia bacterium]